MTVNAGEDNGAQTKPSRRRVAASLITRVGQRIHQETSNPRRGLMAAIALALLVVAWLSWRSLEISLRQVQWPLLGASALLVPLSVGLTAAEYRLAGRSSGVVVNWRDAMTITVVGTIANLLPIPGAAAVRVNDLVARSAKTSRAAAATIGIGVLWLGWALIASGIALVLGGAGTAGFAMGIGGLGAVGASWVIAPRHSATGNSATQWFLTGSAIELSSLCVGAVRIWLTLAAIGTDPTAIQALGLVAAGAIASTVGIVPGGLGIRELIAGILAPLVSLEIAAAIVTIAVVRVIGLIVSAPIAAALAARKAPSE